MKYLTLLLFILSLEPLVPKLVVDVQVAPIIEMPTHLDLLAQQIQVSGGQIAISGGQLSVGSSGSAFVKSSSKAVVCGGEDNEREFNATKAGPTGGWHCYMDNLYDQITEGSKI